ncbi:ubiquitin-associated UBA domain protein [Nitzschia inconspicua]|uniref:Ubiquitin-associated UBA domain protein n=1 Tax=Nitzschia inconspicua TaxID=303405 RepID=A0A9K3L6P1_9STRA|nr:ubiquitin-associated UBA domain protein [Nitzschia inconspicua]KAG7356537.1 ubiquitin-associated UBA domain protein [Nitzschia inconspicua]
MWKRMTDRLSDAVANVSSAAASVTTSSGGNESDDARVAELSAMGFRPAEARHALRQTSGDMQRASEWLLEHGTPVGIQTNNSAVTTHNNSMSTTSQMDRQRSSTSAPIGMSNEDDDIQRAIQASLFEQQRAEKERMNAKSDPQRKKPVKSAASTRAGQAAVQRFESPSPANISTEIPIASHPNVQIPKRLSQHDKEDVILRCAARIAFHPSAVDTLLRSLKTIQANPTIMKYQSIDTTTSGFQRSLNKPGVMDFLKAMNFHPTLSNAQILKLAVLDPATFFLGISALEQVQNTSPDYANNKALIRFDKELEQALELADSDMKEALKRSEFMSQCPSESPTAGSQVTVELGSSQRISRKFDADDTLRDVVHWLGGHSSVIPHKLLETKEWHLIDRNHPDALPYDTLEESGILDRTLQYVGCWPSGRLAVVPTLPHKISLSSNAPPVTSSRGLGAGPVDHFKNV